MSRSPGTLPAYLRLPEGERAAGLISLKDEKQLSFLPRQALPNGTPTGIDATLVIAGLPEGDDAHLSISVTVNSVNARHGVLLTPRQALSPRLRDLLAHDDPDGPANEALKLLHNVEERGLHDLQLSMRRFLTALGDHLFDLSTSSRYGTSGQHAHYDALNRLKRNSQSLIDRFVSAVTESLYRIEKDATETEFADLDAASATSLDIVAFEKIDQETGHRQGRAIPGRPLPDRPGSTDHPRRRESTTWTRSPPAPPSIRAT